MAQRERSAPFVSHYPDFDVNEMSSASSPQSNSQMSANNCHFRFAIHLHPRLGRLLRHGKGKLELEAGEKKRLHKIKG